MLYMYVYNFVPWFLNSFYIISIFPWYYIISLYMIFKDYLRNSIVEKKPLHFDLQIFSPNL